MPVAKPDDFMAAMNDQARWSGRASCKGQDPRMFDTVWTIRTSKKRSVPGTKITEDTGRARAICLECPVMTRCLEHAIRFDVREQVMGGMVDEERDVWALANAADLIPAHRLLAIRRARALAA